MDKMNSTPLLVFHFHKKKESHSSPLKLIASQPVALHRVSLANSWKLQKNLKKIFSTLTVFRRISSECHSFKQDWKEFRVDLCWIPSHKR